MALSTDKKLYIALGVLAVLGGALFLQKQNEKKEEATYTLTGQTADLPKITIKEDDTKAVDRIVISQPPGDAGPGTEVEIQKKDDKWTLAKPIAAKANEANIKSLLDNLKTLEVVERIAPGTSAYAEHGVSDDKATHVTVYKGNDKLLDAYFGKGGSRGQMARIAGKEGVYSVKGYSGYLYGRELKGWRDLSMLSFDDERVSSVEIENEHGTFTFTKQGGKAAPKQDDKDAGAAGASDAKWAGKFKPVKGGAAKPIERFDESKVKDMLRTYKSLNADNFAQDKQPSDVGLDKPIATLTITLDDGAKRVVQLGASSTENSRWALKDGDSQIYSISGWAADWVTKGQDKFQKADEKKSDGGAAENAPAMPGFDHG